MKTPSLHFFLCSFFLFFRFTVSFQWVKNIFIFFVSCVLFASLSSCSLSKKKEMSISSSLEDTEEDKEDDENLFLEEETEDEDEKSELEENGVEAKLQEDSSSNQEDSLANSQENFKEERNTEYPLGEDESSDIKADSPTTMNPLPLENVNDSFSKSGEKWSPMSHKKTRKRWVPVKKIADHPFRKFGFLINAVYIARPGDTLQIISQKIFPKERQEGVEENLLSINPHLRGKKMKVGDKVYYNSPKRPLDEENLFVFYQDQGFSSEIYTTSKRENIRNISENLLGDRNSWKEIWATNSHVTSKWIIPAGTSLTYWTGELTDDFIADSSSHWDKNTESASESESESESDLEDSQPKDQQEKKTQKSESTDLVQSDLNSDTLEISENTEEIKNHSHIETSSNLPPHPLNMSQELKSRVPKKLKRKNNVFLFVGLGVFSLVSIFLILTRKKRRKKVQLYNDFTNT